MTIHRPRFITIAQMEDIVLRSLLSRFISTCFAKSALSYMTRKGNISKIQVKVNTVNYNEQLTDIAIDQKKTDLGSV